MCTGIDLRVSVRENEPHRFPRVYGDRPYALLPEDIRAMVSPCVRG